MLGTGLDDATTSLLERCQPERNSPKMAIAPNSRGTTAGNGTDTGVVLTGGALPSPPAASSTSDVRGKAGGFVENTKKSELCMRDISWTRPSVVEPFCVWKRPLVLAGDVRPRAFVLYFGVLVAEVSRVPSVTTFDRFPSISETGFPMPV